MPAEGGIGPATDGGTLGNPGGVGGIAERRPGGQGQGESIIGVLSATVSHGRPSLGHSDGKQTVPTSLPVPYGVRIANSPGRTREPARAVLLRRHVAELGVSSSNEDEEGRLRSRLPADPSSHGLRLAFEVVRVRRASLFAPREHPRQGRTFVGGQPRQQQAERFEDSRRGE